MAVVYRHWRLDKPEVFYVGIGKDESRAYDFKKARNKIWHSVKNRAEVKVEIVASGLDWAAACELEQLMIQEYGRIDLGTGRLVNLTDGGDGSINVKFSEETKKKMSASASKRIVSQETKEKLSSIKTGSGNGMYGKMPHNAKSIYCGYLNKTFATITSCAKELGVAQSYLSNMLTGKTENIYNISKI
jgi:hypothetical protein